MSDDKVIDDFGLEWKKFSSFDPKDKKLEKIFNNNFKIFPKDFLGKEKVGFDLGCGTGRWALFVAPEVKKLFVLNQAKQLM